MRAEPRVAVVGAGVAGLVCALRLTEAGIETDVYERWPGLGGQAATLDAGDGLLVERYYHYLFTSDEHMIALFGELGLGDDLELHDADSAFVSDGVVYPFNGVGDLLRFKPIPFSTRLRLGLGLLRIQLSRTRPEDHAGETAHEWITRNMGRRAWDGVWGPVMRAKFGERAETIAMAWIWDKVGKRRSIKDGEATSERFIYPKRTFEPLFTALRERIEAGAGRVMIDRPAASVGRSADGFLLQPAAPGSFRRGLDPQTFEPDGEALAYDAVVACVPNDVFADLLDPALREALGGGYLGRLESIEYFTACNLLLELDRPLTGHFWINVADSRCPFCGVIEHTNFVGTEVTGGRTFTHITNYLPAGHELLDLDADELLDRYDDGLRVIDPAWDRSRVRQRWLFHEPAGQPIVGTGYPERIPPRQTPVPGLLLVNTTQIFPDDRGTNFAVRDGERAAAEVAELLGSA